MQIEIRTDIGSIACADSRTARILEALSDNHDVHAVDLAYVAMVLNQRASLDHDREIERFFDGRIPAAAKAVSGQRAAIARQSEQQYRLLSTAWGSAD